MSSSVQRLGMLNYTRQLATRKIFKFKMLRLKNLNLILKVSLRYGEGNGTPLLYSCLENPMDGGAC